MQSTLSATWLASSPSSMPPSCHRHLPHVSHVITRSHSTPHCAEATTEPQSPRISHVVCRMCVCGVLCLPVPPDVFDRLASAQLRYLHDGLVEMQQQNQPHFHLTLQPHSRLTLTLAPHIGTYEVTVEAAQQRLVLFSPVSGVYKYEWSGVKEAWVSETDQHFLVELLVRELLKNCQGVPKL